MGNKPALCAQAAIKEVVNQIGHLGETIGLAKKGLAFCAISQGEEKMSGKTRGYECLICHCICVEASSTIDMCTVCKKDIGITELEQELKARDKVLEEIALDYKSPHLDNKTPFEFIKEYGKATIQGMISQAKRSIQPRGDE